MRWLGVGACLGLWLGLTAAKKNPSDDQIAKELVELQLQGYALDDAKCIKKAAFKLIKPHYEGTEEEPRSVELVVLSTDNVMVKETAKDADGYRKTHVVIERENKPIFEDHFVWTRYTSSKVIAELGAGRVIKPFSKVVVWERCQPSK